MKNSDDKIYIAVTVFLIWLGFMNIFLGCCFSQKTLEQGAQNNTSRSGPAVAASQPVVQGKSVASPVANIDNSV